MTISGGKPVIGEAAVRVDISTIHALETRGLVALEDCVPWLNRERVHLTADGCHALAAAFSRPRAAARPAASPSATAARRATH